MRDIDNGVFMIFAEIQEVEGEKLLVIRLIAPKDPNQETPEEVPKFNIYIDESWNTRDYITTALTDITHRTFTEDQLTLMSPSENTPNHLKVEKTKKIETAHAVTTPSETLVLITAEPDERDEHLTVLNTRTGEEFKVSTQISLIDALADFITPLKVKTFANTNLEVTSSVSLQLITNKLSYMFNTLTTKSGLLLSLPDGSDDIELSLHLTNSPEPAALKITYEYEDLVIGKKISGGLNVNM